MGNNSNQTNKVTLWKNGTLYTAQGVVKNGWMLVDEQGRIKAMGGPESMPAVDEGSASKEGFPTDLQIRDFEGLSVLPGFIDVHVHGGGGFHAMAGTFEGIDGMSHFHAAHGTTSFLATTGTSSEEKITKALRSSAEAMKSGVSGAQLLGVHLEGPFLDTVRAGAQDRTQLRPPRIEELERYIEASGNTIRLVTLAPELEGGAEAVKMLVQRGITVSIGHSNATFNQVGEAIEHGVNHTTHHFNGMSPFHHRDPGVAGAGMIRTELTTELIADGFHVHPSVVKLLFDVKGPENVCMITDAVDCAGLPDGDYGGKVMKNGEIYLSDGSSLAGSSLTMLKGLRNAIEYTGYPLEKLLPSMSAVPARQIGVSERKGSLDIGKDADFILVDDSLNLYSTIVRGREVYKRSEE